MFLVSDKVAFDPFDGRFDILVRFDVRPASRPPRRVTAPNEASVKIVKAEDKVEDKDKKPQEPADAAKGEKPEKPEAKKPAAKKEKK